MKKYHLRDATLDDIESDMGYPSFGLVRFTKMDAKKDVPVFSNKLKFKENVIKRLYVMPKW